MLKKEVQDFLHQRADAIPASIALAKSPFPSVSSAELAIQVESRQKARLKLPGLVKPCASAISRIVYERDMRGPPGERVHHRRRHRLRPDRRHHGARRRRLRRGRPESGRRRRLGRRRLRRRGRRRARAGRAWPGLHHGIRGVHAPHTPVGRPGCQAVAVGCLEASTTSPRCETIWSTMP